MNNSHYSQTTLKQFTAMTEQNEIKQPVMTAEQQQRFQQSAMNFLSAFEVAVGEPEKTISALDNLSIKLIESPEFARFIANPDKITAATNLINKTVATFGGGIGFDSIFKLGEINEIVHEAQEIFKDL